MRPEDLRQQAERWRRLARRFAHDQKTAKALTDAAEKLEAQAVALETGDGNE
jgi:hypothetical protein